MSWTRNPILALIGVTVLPVVVACSTGTARPAADGVPEGAANDGSARRLVTLLHTGSDVDYEPLASPRDAVEKADLIVRGSLAEITEGIAFANADPAVTARRANTYVTFVVEVGEVLAGDAAAVRDGRVYVEVPRSPAI